jgi:hypothetical protein
MLPDQIVFAGEATDERPMTGAIVTVASLGADRAVVRIARKPKSSSSEHATSCAPVLSSALD